MVFITAFLFFCCSRIEPDKNLLLNTDWNLDLLADSSGYYDGPGLSGYFKKHVGCTPGECRKYGRKGK
jgi:AraC-like DNA-binding protein